MTQLAFGSDWHYGAVSASFNVAIAEKRIGEFFNAITDRDYHLCLNGDLIDGTDIHPYQNTMIEYPARQQADEMVQLLRKHLKKKPPRKIRLTYGNHGRTSKSAHPENNWDLEIGYRLRDLGFQVDIPRGQPDLRFKINDTTFWMIHRIKENVSSLASNAKIGVCLRRLYFEQADVMLLGHFHQGTAHSLEDEVLKLVINGAMGEPDLHYSKENGYYTPPRQAIVNIPKKGRPMVGDVSWVRW